MAEEVTTTTNWQITRWIKRDYFRLASTPDEAGGRMVQVGVLWLTRIPWSRRLRRSRGRLWSREWSTPASSYGYGNSDKAHWMRTFLQRENSHFSNSFKLIWRVMKEPTLVINYSAAPSVTINAPFQVLWRNIRDSILVIGHTAAPNVTTKSNAMIQDGRIKKHERTHTWD